MKIPTKQQCYELMDKYMLPKNVREHCEIVNKVAVFIAKKLKKKGVDVNVELVDAASLLHDVLRMVDFNDLDDMDETNEDVKLWKELALKFKDVWHGEAAYIELKDEYPEVALIINKHGFHDAYAEKTIEEKIIVYADARGHVHKVVSIKERFEDFKNRHKNIFDELVKKKGEMYSFDNLLKQNLKLEKELFSHLDIESDELGKFIS